MGWYTVLWIAFIKGVILADSGLFFKINPGFLSHNRLDLHRQSHIS